jgi:PAS domain S-box-containing protein
MIRTTRSILFRYGGALVFTAAAVILSWLVNSVVGDYLSLAPLYGAVALATWLGGYRPAVLAVVLGYLACDYLFIEPRGTVLLLDARNLAALILYLSSCAIIIGFGEAMHAARRHLEIRQRELEQAVAQLRCAEEESARESETRLAAELEGTTRLHALSTRLLSADNLETALDDVLENAIATSAADLGNIQLCNPQIGALEMVVQRGFRQEFLDCFRSGLVEKASACAQAMTSGERTMIEDVNLDPAYEPYRPVAAAAGFRAVQSTPLKNRKGSILGMLSMHFRAPHRVSDRDQRLLDLYARHAVDLIERFHSEEALRQSEQRFARFMHHLPGLAWIKDVQGRYVYANESAMYVFGRTADQLYGRTDDEVFPPVTAAQFKQNDHKALTSETGVQIIETLEHQEGIVHHSVVSKFPILGPEGSPFLIGGIAIDVTDRLRAENVLAESEERFRQLAENVNEIFWMSDPQTTQLLYISPAYERVWGRSCQSLYENPRSFMDAVHPDDQERVRIAVLENQSRGEQTDKEYRVVRPDGSIRWVRDRAFPVKDAGGQFYRVVGIVDDFTERKLAEDALKEADRRKDEFLATLAHELRNPLAPIRNGLQIMRLAGNDHGAVEQARAVMERQLQILVRLVDDLLDLSRISRGKIELHKERTELAAVLNSALETCDPLMKQNDHELIVTVPDRPLYVDADKTRLAQALCNLLTNAAKFSDRGGSICLTAKQQGSDVVVSVKDTGVGIPPHMLPTVFEMFTQLDRSLEKSHGGLGIGLSIVKRLVEMHGGTVEARSEGPGMGSEFLIRLPVVLSLVQGQEQDGDNQELARPMARHRILVVDDNVDSAHSLAMMLDLMGNEVRTAHDGLEAVAAAAAYQPDLILLDLGMPGLNGYEACRRIREHSWGKGILIAAVTGWGLEEDRRLSREVGFDHHLVKPVGHDAVEKLLVELRARTA